MEKQQEMIGPWALRTMKERALIAKAKAKSYRASMRINSSAIAATAPETGAIMFPVCSAANSVNSTEDTQAEWNWFDEGRHFKVTPNCVCGFPAILTKRVNHPDVTFKIVCTRIRCTYEVGPDHSRERLLRAWRLLVTLSKL